MIPRSWLFVPGDSERKQTKALESKADALILDLEDSVAPPRLPAARELVAAVLKARTQQRRPELWVRVNALSSGVLLEDLTAVMGGAPDGIVLPKIATPADVAQTAYYLDAFEAREGLPRGATRLLPIATETPRALLGAQDYSAIGPRLAGLTWGAEDLATALGATANRGEDGMLAFIYLLARSRCLLSAAAAGVPAIDTVWVDFRDARGLALEAAEGRRDGFAGKLAIHPDQIEPINAAFTPTAEEIEQARRVAAAFEAAPGAGVVSLDGRMLDRPHLVQARRILSLADGPRRG